MLEFLVREMGFRVRKSAELGEWLDAPHPMRSVGSMYGAGFEQSSFSPITIGKEFDGLFFIDTTSRAPESIG